MPVYNNNNHAAAITSLEFTPVSDGNFAFFHVRDTAQVAAVKQWLASEHILQVVVAETTVGGHPVLITQGAQGPAQLLQALAAQGDMFTFQRKTHSLSDIAWPLRSALGVGGQCLQLTSSLLRGRRDWPLFVFAVSNLTANAINIAFGPQKSEDVHRLRFLKDQTNQGLSPYVQEGKPLPDSSEQRLLKRKQQGDPASAYKEIDGFIKHHSVTLGELGLRYLGALSIATDRNKLRRCAGWGSITGKTTALISKTPDPYDPHPHNWLDTLREKVTFRLGGIIEALSFATLAYDGFTNQKITFPDRYFVPAGLRGQTRRDYLSGIGACMFTAAYIIRNWAKFGEKEMNMDELYAHVSDSLATMPPEKLPQLMADTAAHLADNFTDKHIDFSHIFTKITTDLYRYHHIAIDMQHPAAQPKDGKISDVKEIVTAELASAPPDEAPGRWAQDNLRQKAQKQHDSGQMALSA